MRLSREVLHTYRRKSVRVLDSSIKDLLIASSTAVFRRELTNSLVQQDDHIDYYSSINVQNHTYAILQGPLEEKSSYPSRHISPPTMQRIFGERSSSVRIEPIGSPAIVSIVPYHYTLIYSHRRERRKGRKRTMAWVTARSEGVGDELWWRTEAHERIIVPAGTSGHDCGRRE